MRLAAQTLRFTVDPAVARSAMFHEAPRYARSPRDWLASPLGWVTWPLALAVGLFCLHLWPEWDRNPDLSHGFFAPLIFALLVWEGSRTSTQRWLKPGWPMVLGLVVCLVVAVGFFALGGLLAASVGWSHAVVLFCFATTLVALLAAGLIVLADDRIRAVPFNWTLLTAIGLWLLVAPLPTGTYTRLTLALQNSVTTGVLNALHLLGIPARQSGNIIELASTSVGVEDACSGIRSLISCLYAGFFFAAWLVRGAGKRAVLIALAPVLAVVMNFGRSLLLTLLANSGKSIEGFWHDTTGYAILGLTAALLAGLAALLSPSGAPTTHPAVPFTSGGQSSFRLLGGAFGAGAAALLALGAFFYSASRGGAPVANTPPPDVAALLPAQPDGWMVKTTEDLYRFSGILQTQHLVERTYARLINGRPVQLNVYVAHWTPGAAPVSLVASHTPDACWPGAGWQAQPNPERQVSLALGSERLAPAEHRIFRYGNTPQQVWFWHIYNGRAITYRDPYSIPALLEIALQYGFSREGAQYFVRVSSNVPWEDIRDEALVREIVANLGPLGLKP